MLTTPRIRIFVDELLCSVIERLSSFYVIPLRSPLRLEFSSICLRSLRSSGIFLFSILCSNRASPWQPPIEMQNRRLAPCRRRHNVRHRATHPASFTYSPDHSVRGAFIKQRLIDWSISGRIAQLPAFAGLCDARDVTQAGGQFR